MIQCLESNPVIFANAKLSLFYEWLLYNPELDNIMNIGQLVSNLILGTLFKRTCCVTNVPFFSINMLNMVFCIMIA